MNSTESNEIERRIELLSRFVTERRLARLQEVAAARTGRITLVLEDVCNAFNATAVTRTCEGLGIHEMHIVENDHRFQLSPGVTQGAAKWLDMQRWRDSDRRNTERCIASLHERGYRVVATTPHRSGHSPDSLPLDRPVAIVFGHEKSGVSDRAIELSDDTLRIPMYGFVESFNITVSAGMCMSRLRTRLQQERPGEAPYPVRFQRELLMKWLEWSVPRKVLESLDASGAGE